MRACLTTSTLLSLLCLGLCACGGSSAPGAAPDSAGLPPVGELRAVSAQTDPYLSGAAVADQSTVAVPFGVTLGLDASAQDSPPQWALYYLNPAGDWDSISVLLDSAAGAWLCLANYTTGRWDSHGPYTGLATVAAPAPDYRSADGGLWVAVVCPPGALARVYALSTVAPSPGNQPPTAGLQANAPGGSAPLTISFDAGASLDPDGAVIQYAWDFDGDGLWDDFTATMQAAHTYTTPGVYSATLRITDDQLTHSASVSVDIQVSAGNTPPQVQLAASALADVPGAALDLDASGSSDPDGTVTDYEWDLDGDSDFNEPGAEAAAQGSATVSTVFPAQPAYFSVSVRVTDDLGAQATASLDLTAQGWLKLVIDDDAPLADTNRSSSQTSLALIGGKPAISYRANGTLRYAWSTEPDGADGWSSVEVDPVCSPGQTTLAEVDGKPAIGYDGLDLLGSTEVRYSRSTAADGSGGWSSALLGSNGGYDLSIAVTTAGGFPLAAYIEDTMGKVVFVRNDQADGGGAWTSVEEFVGVGAVSRLLPADGNPAIALSSGKLIFARNAAADGGGIWSSVDADATANVGTALALALVGGKPAASHSNFTDKDLIYSWSTAADGATGWSSVAVDSAGSAGRQTALGVAGGFPVIAYHDADDDVLRFARSGMADGSGGWTRSVIDTGAGVFVSMVVLAGGQPAVSYYDFANSDLKFAVLFE